MRLNLIAAIDRLGGIGYGNRLPWSISGDLRFFKQITWGQALIMGRATFDSLGRRALPGRSNIVLSRSGHDARARNNHIDDQAVLFAASLEQALSLADSGQEVFFIGGAKLYAQIIERVERMYITRVNGSFKVDSWFAEFDERQWQPSLLQDHWHELPYGWRIDRYDRT